MKRIAQAIALLAFLAVAQHASAATGVLVMKNGAGGAVVLTEKQGACPELYREAYATGEPDMRLDGCWRLYDDGMVVAFWPGSRVRVYKITDFVPLTRTDA